MDKVERLKKRRDALGEQWNLLHEQINELHKSRICENNILVGGGAFNIHIQIKQQYLDSIEQQIVRLEEEIEFLTGKKQDAANAELIKPLVVEPVISNQVFISYSHQDHEWLSKLQIHLKPMIRNQTLDVWDDTKIQPGAEWRKEIENALRVAKVAVLLVSPEFLASDFIAENELPPLLNAAQTEGLTIIWIPLTHSCYEGTEIEKYQATHPPNSPLDSLNASEQNRALVDICKQIKEAANPQQKL